MRHSPSGYHILRPYNLSEMLPVQEQRRSYLAGASASTLVNVRIPSLENVLHAIHDDLHALKIKLSLAIALVLLIS